MNANNQLEQRYRLLLHRIRQAESSCGRKTGSTKLLAVSKTRSAEEIRALAGLGQRRFGENYLQESEEKILQLRDLPIEWHFIGRIQSNKTRAIAQHFDWVHSVASLKHARRLNEQRPPEMPPLNICLQVNTSGEASKDGHDPELLPEMLADYASLPNLRVQGLMTIPAPAQSATEMRYPFQLLRNMRDRLASTELPLETLSMGMSDDLEVAIAEGATLIRIGTAIFGPRAYNQST
ncbi:MAG: YggS family pyridoxal phosphate-dependent enzyme [Candidatus Thiodiazotropha sp. (ex Monitilora ramsayi)]|nr:YggS family pyridoxal phosphate-dependent enzyme [Candidatus Thiodiazotropha sp. (ex Monitilora ramsayi)]